MSSTAASENRIPPDSAFGEMFLTSLVLELQFSTVSSDEIGIIPAISLFQVSIPDFQYTVTAKDMELRNTAHITNSEQHISYWVVELPVRIIHMV